MQTTVLALLLAALTAPAAGRETDAGLARLTLTFATGAKTGAVMVSLYDSRSAYAGGPPIRQARVDVAKGERTAIFADLTTGTYAVKAFHDVDGNGRMNTNPFGLPTEPFAFSNNVRGNMGPASWDRARFNIAGIAAQTIDIR